MLAPAQPLPSPFSSLRRTIGRCRADLAERGDGDQQVAGSLGVFRPSRGRDDLQAENQYLRREVQERLSPGIIVGRSAAIQRVLEQARQVAATDATVLLLGETGTGKELIATQIHEQSARRSRVMVRINCAAIPGTLIESELFGREKGAFTGALARQIGRFELADRSTIFLDEIGDLPFDVQVKLLRVLEERQIERLGSPRADQGQRPGHRRDAPQSRTADCRRTFRQDLYYRLNVFPIDIPPLRERAEDIPLLVWRFVDEFSKTFGKRIDAISRENMAALQRYPWPGNVRELRNVVERSMITALGESLTLAVPRRRRSRAAAKSCRMSRPSTSGASSSPPAGGFAESMGRPSGWACARRRSRRAWRSWGSSGRWRTLRDLGVGAAARPIALVRQAARPWHGRSASFAGSVLRRRRGVAERVGDPELLPLVPPHLVERQDVDSLDVAELGRELAVRPMSSASSVRPGTRT